MKFEFFDDPVQSIGNAQCNKIRHFKLMHFLYLSAVHLEEFNLSINSAKFYKNCRAPAPCAGTFVAFYFRFTSGVTSLYNSKGEILSETRRIILLSDQKARKYKYKFACIFSNVDKFFLFCINFVSRGEI